MTTYIVATQQGPEFDYHVIAKQDGGLIVDYRDGRTETITPEEVTAQGGALAALTHRFPRPEYPTIRPA